MSIQSEKKATRREFLAFGGGAAVGAVGGLIGGYVFGSAGGRERVEPSIETLILDEVFSEDFTNGRFISGQKGRDARDANYSEIGMSGDMYIGSGVLQARNIWEYSTKGMQILPGFGVVSTFPQLGIVSNSERMDYRLVLDVPLGTAMQLSTRESLSIKTPAIISFKAGGGHDPVKLQAYIGNKFLDEIIPPLGGRQLTYEIQIPSMQDRINERLAFVASGSTSLGVYCHLDYVKIYQIEKWK